MLPSSPGDRQLNVPVPLTRLIGRERDIAAVSDLLSRPTVRLVTLTGPGGVGKTRLAMAVAERVRGAFSDGVVFVALQYLTEPDLLPVSIAQALEVRAHGDQTITERLMDVLRDRQLLLILDNFEQILPSAPFLSELLDFCPNLAILVTSRVVLNLYGGHDYIVPPLALPDAAKGWKPEQVRDIPAVRLFVERSQAVQPGFALTAENASAVVAICARLDGLPLAIELAAARMRLLSPAVLLARLEQRLIMLSGGPLNMPVRQQTMRETIAWSYDLLTSEQRSLLRQLTVFAGGWTLEGAEAVCDPELMVFENLGVLVDHSLVRQAGRPDGDQRFDMLETIHEFGVEQLTASEDLDTIRRRHAEYFLASFEDAEFEWAGPDAARWAVRSEVEFGNLRNALAWAVERDADIALRLIQMIGGCWETLGYYGEARRWCELALSSKQPASPSLRAYALFEAGFLATTQGDYQAGWDYSEEGLALYTSIGDRQGAAWCLYGMGRAAMWSADHELAARLYEETLEAAKDVDDRLLRSALGNLGAVYVLQRRYDQAAQLLSEAIARAREADHVVGLGFIIPDYALLALRQGDPATARQRLDEALEIQQHLRDPRYASQSLEVAAWIASAQQQPLSAARLLGAVSRFREMIGVRIPPMTRIYYDEYLPQARAQASERAWDTAWQDGRESSLEEAIAYALEQEQEPGPDALSGLSKRELEVLPLLVEGKSNQEIAAALFISPNTVATHVANIMNKLGLDSRTAVATWAVRQGFD